jgi:GTPase SAR1 family protein
MNSDDTTSSTQEKFKIVMLGDMGVGKSSIVERLISDRFDEGKNVLVSLI